MAQITPDQKRMARLAVGNATITLNTTAMLLMHAREGTDSPEGQEFITALRDDITRMLGDVDVLKTYMV